MTKIITELTSEQIVLFSSFVEKWRLIALSTEPIDRQKAVKSVGAAYELIGKKQPEVIFFRSPYEAILEISALADSQQDFVRAREISLYKLVLEILSAWGRNAMPRVSWRRFLSQAYQQINHARELLIYELLTRCHSQMGIGWRELNKGAKLIDRLSPELYFYPDVVACDFSITIHKDNPQPWEWSVFRDLITDCGWIFAFKRVCFVCDHPRILSFDSENRLHAEGEPAIQFADGFTVYAYDGIPLPEEYGRFHPSQWYSEWLLLEENSEYRRILIQGIGYDRLCQELRATELDSWQSLQFVKD